MGGSEDQSGGVFGNGESKRLTQQDNPTYQRQGQDNGFHQELRSSNTQTHPDDKMPSKGFWSNLNGLRVALVAAAVAALVSLVWACSLYLKSIRSTSLLSAGGHRLAHHVPKTQDGKGHPHPRATPPLNWVNEEPPYPPQPRWDCHPDLDGRAKPTNPPKTQEPFVPAATGGRSQPTSILEDEPAIGGAPVSVGAGQTQNPIPTGRSVTESSRTAPRKSDSNNSALDRDMREINWRKQPANKQEGGAMPFPSSQREEGRNEA
jgi:hypothetical protein